MNLQQNVNSRDIPAWALQQHTGLTYNGAPRQYRFDGSMGIFVIGEQFVGTKITAQIITTRWKDGERWGRTRQSWLDVAFVDDTRVVSLLALKKESAINLHEWMLSSLRETTTTTIDPSAVRVELEATERLTQEQEKYWVVSAGDWEFVTKPEFDQVQEFYESNRMDWIYTGEVS